MYLPGTIDHPFAHTLGATTPTTVRYHEVDELGNVIGTIESGSASQTDSYDAWGTVTYAGNADQHLVWKGLFWNGDFTGLYYVRNRWYDPEGGRFVNEDPAGFAGGLNLYAFSGNDPINGKDPYGLTAAIECYWVPDPDQETGTVSADGQSMSVTGARHQVCVDGGGGTDGGGGSGPSTYDPGHGGGGGSGGTAQRPQAGPNSAACTDAGWDFLFTLGADALGVTAVKGVKLLAKAADLHGTLGVDVAAWRAWHFGGSLIPADRPSNWAYLSALTRGSGNLSIDLALKMNDMRSVLAAESWNAERVLAVAGMVPVVGSGVKAYEMVTACRK